ncbi:MAG: ABC transporter substrate-binding protein, partial [Acidimicrobiaceae bacterium]|nr:ABC transporter substrate-binding protein [Acidimicrobiaceae bacterium]
QRGGRLMHGRVTKQLALVALTLAAIIAMTAASGSPGPGTKSRPALKRCPMGFGPIYACGSLHPRTHSGPGVTDTNNLGINSSSITFGLQEPASGPSAPGYDETTAASEAYFQYVNAQGGVLGRKIRLKVNGYEVFATFERLDTQAHANVASDLTAKNTALSTTKVPDLFVDSGCPCWGRGSSQPNTFGWQPSSTIEGKILGRYIRQHFPGQKVGVLYQDDAFGQGGLAGIDDEVRGADIVSKQPYQPGATTLAPQIAALQAAGAAVLVDFTLPNYTAMGQLAELQLGYKPQLVVSNVGIDPTTVGALLKTLSNGQASGTAPIEGAITDGYLPSPSATANPWIRLFREVQAQYGPVGTFDSNVVYGMANAYTLVQALKAAGRNLTRQKLVNAINDHGANWKGPGLVPFRYSRTDHSGYAGAEMGKIQNGKIVLFGNPLTTDASPHGPVRPYAAHTPPPPTNGIPSGKQSR